MTLPEGAILLTECAQKGCRTWKRKLVNSSAYLFTELLDLLFWQRLARKKDGDLIIKVFDIGHVEIVLFEMFHERC